MKKICAILIALALAVLPGVCALAEGGDGSGGGSGSPLALDWSSVPDGSTDVPADVTITLTFTKNVVNFTVKDNNMGCFRLVDSGGSSVPISVIMGDDQVDSSVKRIISIAPDTLAAGETYTLIISGGLQAKNGTYLGSDVYLTFTTAGAAAVEEPPAETPEESGQDASETTEEPPEETEPAPEPEKPDEPKPEEPGEPKPETAEKPAKEAEDAAPAEEPKASEDAAESGKEPDAPALIAPTDGAEQSSEKADGAKHTVYYAAGGVVAAAALALAIFRKKK